MKQGGNTSSPGAPLSHLSPLPVHTDQSSTYSLHFLHSSPTSAWWESAATSKCTRESASAVCLTWAVLQAVMTRHRCMCRIAGKDAALQQCLCGLCWLKDLLASQRCVADPALKLPPVRPSASFSPSLGLRPLPFLHPSICYTLPFASMCQHLTRVIVLLEGRMAAGNEQRQELTSCLALEKSFLPPHFNFSVKQGL